MQMNYQALFENALDVAAYVNPTPFLPELKSDEIDFIFASQISDFNLMKSASAEESEEDELDDLVNAVRKTRITIGFTQSEMARSISALCGKKISQTTVCRFEGKILPKRNLRRLRPTFEHWMHLGRTDPTSVREASFRQQIRRTQRA